MGGESSFPGPLLKGVVLVSSDNWCPAESTEATYHQRWAGPTVRAFGLKLASPKGQKDIFVNIQDKVKNGCESSNG